MSVGLLVRLGSIEYVQDSKGRVKKPLALVNYGNPAQSALAWKPLRLLIRDDVRCRMLMLSLALSHVFVFSSVESGFYKFSLSFCVGNCVGLFRYDKV